MSGPNPVNRAACALAAGLADADGRHLRVTVTLTPSAGDGDFDLSKWPTMARTLTGLTLRVAEPDPTHRDRIGRELRAIELRSPAGAHPLREARTLGQVQELWERVMAPGTDATAKAGAWDAFRRVLQAMAAPLPAAGGAGRVVAPPTHLAALAYPFERGRMVLEALGMANAGTPGPGAAADAPGQVLLAALDVPGTSSDAPPLGGESAPPGTGRDAPAQRVRPSLVARAAMGHCGALGAILDGVRAAHGAATPEACRVPDPTVAKAPDDPAADAAARRLAALQGAPVLQRLFGLAIDLEAALGGLEGGVPPEGRFLLLAVGGAGGVPLWTLSKVRLGEGGAPGYFGPASWDEYAARGAMPGTAASAEGVEALGRRTVDGHPAYDLSTVDPELAIEGDVGASRQRAKGELRSDQRGTLRSGGLRLLATLPDDAAEAAVRDAGQGRAAAALAGNGVVQDADALHPLGRLDLGIDGIDGPAWRCAGHRIVRYVDPSPAASPRDWIEAELTRLLGPANGQRRMDLDAATVSRSRATIQAVVPAPGAQGPHFPDPVKYPKEHAEAVAENAPDESAAQAATTEAVTVAGTTVASWGGEPMGSPTARSDCPAGEELAITRIVSLPSARTGDPSAHLAMPMRFGWPYRVGLRKAFPAGVCVPLAAAAIRYGDAASRASLPSPPAAGRRLLRHERIEAPLLGMLAGAAADARGPMPAQGAGRAVVRTAPERPSTAVPRVARRILAAPNVPLQFATLHDAFRGWRPARGTGRRTPPGGPLDGRLRGGQGDPLLVDVTRAPLPCEDPRYPDPAASIMVLRLRNPTTNDAWLEPPVVVPLLGKWPDVQPVLLELHAEDPGRAPRLARAGTAVFGTGRHNHAALVAQGVRASLRAGEDLALDAWCVPSIDQLVEWFDVVEVAGLLAALDPAAAGQASIAACAAVLAAPLAEPALPDALAAVACTAGGGLPAPSPAALRPLAAALHQAMLQHPVPIVAGVQTLRLTHATALPRAMPKLDASGPSRLALVRRLFPGGDGDGTTGGGKGETRLGFIESVPAERWSESTCQEGAPSTLFAGAIEVDLASTAAVELEVECADPSGDLLDDDKRRRRTPGERAAADWKAAAGAGGLDALFGFAVQPDRRVRLPKRTVVPLRIDGLPAPSDGLPGCHRLALEGLQAAAWNSQAKDATIPDAARPALKAHSDGVFATTGARLLRVTPVAVARHANLMLEASEATVEGGKHRGTSSRGETVEIWLPSTRRPAPPIVQDVQVRLGSEGYFSEAHGSRTVGIRQTSHIRVRLRRPWYSSGEGERLGLVLWPPSLFFRDPPIVDDTGRSLPDQMLDEDIGPGGAFVTRWAADSTDAAGGRLSQLVPAGAFSVSDEDPASRISMASMPLPNVDPTAESVPAALLPAPPGSGAAPGGNGSEAPRAPDPQFMSVALLTSEPRFDVEAELWFVDLELRTEGMSDPYVRLGLVRYQPHARDDAAPAEGEEQVRLRVSTPVSVPARVLPGRTAEATWRKAAGGGTDVYVTARVSRPMGPGGAAASGPATRITLMARRRDPGQHVGQMATAIGTDTKPCLWESWTGAPNGAIAHSDGTTSFTCLFTLPGEVEDQKWEHVAMVEAFSRRPPATYSPEPIPAAGDETLVESGPDFLAMLELRPPDRAAAAERGGR